MTELERLARVAKLRNLRTAIDAELGSLGAAAVQLSALERIEAHASARKRAPAPCGTDSGYYRHLRTTKTPPCDECLAAHREYERHRARRQKDAVA